MKSMSKIMPAASTSTVAPMRSWRVAGIVNGAMQVEIRSVPSVSDMLPSYRETHIVEVTAMGTVYSSTMPQMMSVSVKKRCPMAHPRTGMRSWEIRMAKIMGKGCENVRFRFPKSLERDPWKVMTANIGET